MGVIRQKLIAVSPIQKRNWITVAEADYLRLCFPDVDQFLKPNPAQPGTYHILRRGSAYLCFVSTHTIARDQVEKSKGAMAAELATRWKAMDPAARKPFIDRETALRQRHKEIFGDIYKCSPKKKEVTPPVPPDLPPTAFDDVASSLEFLDQEALTRALYGNPPPYPRTASASASASAADPSQLLAAARLQPPNLPWIPLPSTPLSVPIQFLGVAPDTLPIFSIPAYCPEFASFVTEFFLQNLGGSAYVQHDNGRHSLLTFTPALDPSSLVSYILTPATVFL